MQRKFRRPDKSWQVGMDGEPAPPVGANRPPAAPTAVPTTAWHVAVLGDYGAHPSRNTAKSVYVRMNYPDDRKLVSGTS